MIANALPRPLTAGSVDNAILRADGTGGSTLQNSGLIVEDAIESFAVTGVASTDIITATGSAFANGQPVRFTALTGGAGLNTTTNYYVINVSGATFQVSTSFGGGASLFTTDITAGTLVNGHSVSTNVTLSENTTATNSDLVLTPKGTGAFILGPKPDGTATGGNARGANAVDLQTALRTVANQVASGANSFIGSGRRNRASGADAIVVGGSLNTASGSDSPIIVGGSENVADGGNGATVVGGYKNKASGGFSSFVGAGGHYSGSNVGNTASGSFSAVLCGTGTLADRFGMQAHANGSFSGTTSGDAQRARFVMRNKTTTNSAVELFLDGSSTRLTIPSGKIFAFTINIAGVSITGGAVAHYMRQYCLKNVAATTSEVYAPITIGTDNAAGTSLSLTFNDPADALVVSVTGTASTIWRWVASVDAVEIAYGT